MSDERRSWGGRYEELGPLGRGGQGRVIRAWDTVQRRLVAIKLRHVDAAGRDAVLDEARLLLQVRPHPNVAVVRSDFFEGDEHGLVMDFVDGHSLAGGEPRTASEVVAVVNELAAALDHLHGHQPPVVHGDVKPSNVVVRRDGGGVVLVDFGSARDERRAGGVFGTQGFAAPDAVASPSSDVYGLAATAFALLTGTPPGPGAGESLEPRLRSVVAKGLSLRPEQRFATATAFAAALSEAAGVVLPQPASARSPRRRAPLAVAMAAMLALLAIAVIANRDNDDPTRPTASARVTTTVASPSQIAGAVVTTTTTRATGVTVTSTAPAPATARPVMRALLFGSTSSEVVALDDSGGSTALHSTTVGTAEWTSVARLFDNQLLFYALHDGDNRLATIQPDGSLVVGRDNPSVPPSFEHVVGLGDGLVFFHRAEDGHSASHRYSDRQRLLDGDNYPDSTELTGYTHVAPAGPAQVLAYRSTTGEARVVQLGAEGQISIGPVRSLPAQWRVVAANGAGVVVGIGGDGVAHALSVRDTNVTRTGALAIGGVWSHGTGAGGVTLLHNRDSGTAIALKVSGGAPQIVARYALPPARNVAAVA